MAAVKHWVIVPAAGNSRRMGEVFQPKQYLPLVGRTVLEWALAPFLGRTDCNGIIVVLARDDKLWRNSQLSSHPKVTTAIGGTERADSVRAGLVALAGRADDRDWVLVHDAARPCLRAEDLDRLLRELQDDEVGGLLAAPVVDTLKRADEESRVAETVSRSALWRALTPQMFRLGVLRQALSAAQERNISVTDEAQAIEALGLHPRLVAGDPDNVKVTVAEDLQRAERMLRSWNVP
ncbi:MAG: 2-C-methyl-D-erythritol 4-phosphate cytidylyltransferase [Steroidobacteraceae bacterium]